jgi:hypothetical protein
LDNNKIKNKNMKQIIASVSIVALTAMLIGTVALAATTGQVTATVTASVVAVTVSDSSVAYGVVATTRDTTNDEADDTQTITNTGTINEDFEVKGQNSTGQVWTLAGSAGDATYAHKTCITTCDASPSWTALTASYVDLATSKAPSGTTGMDLQVTVPTSNAGTGQATLPVDVLASAS